MLISTFSITVLFSITETGKREVLDNIENMGAGRLELFGGMCIRTGERDERAGLISLEDLSWIKRRCKFIKAISPLSYGDTSGGAGSVEIEGKKYFPGPPPGNMLGILPDYKKIKGLKVIEGRFINNLDVKLKRRVCVLGNTTYRLLGGKKIIGKKLRLYEPYVINPKTKSKLIMESFTVIGALARIKPFLIPFSKDNQTGEYDFSYNLLFEDNGSVFIPCPVILELVEPEDPENKGYLGQIYISVQMKEKPKQRLGDYGNSEKEWNEKIAKGEFYFNREENITVHSSIKNEALEIINLLKQKYGKDKKFLMYSRDRLIDAMDTQTRQANTFIGTIGAISLTASIISILSIMLLSVTQRTSEIGLRRAIGARKKDIFSQFLIEALVITGIGGIFGMVFGIMGIKIIGYYASWNMVIPVYGIFISLGTSMAVGVIGGLYPAIRASKISPAQAVKYE
ncbi:MAG: FtsX-like permease family protein [bacterium]